jgi:hypothetical protein
VELRDQGIIATASDIQAGTLGPMDASAGVGTKSFCPDMVESASKIEDMSCLWERGPARRCGFAPESRMERIGPDLRQRRRHPGQVFKDGPKVSG